MPCSITIFITSWMCRLAINPSFFLVIEIHNTHVLRKMIHGNITTRSFRDERNVLTYNEELLPWQHGGRGTDSLAALMIWFTVRSCCPGSMVETVLTACWPNHLTYSEELSPWQHGGGGTDSLWAGLKIWITVRGCLPGSMVKAVLTVWLASWVPRIYTCRPNILISQTRITVVLVPDRAASPYSEEIKLSTRWPGSNTV